MGEVFFYEPQRFVAQLSRQDSSCIDYVSGSIIHELDREQLKEYQSILQDLYGKSTDPDQRSIIKKLMENAAA